MPKNKAIRLQCGKWCSQEILFYLYTHRINIKCTFFCQPYDSIFDHSNEEFNADVVVNFIYSVMQKYEKEPRSI